MILSDASGAVPCTVRHGTRWLCLEDSVSLQHLAGQIIPTIYGSTALKQVNGRSSLDLVARPQDCGFQWSDWRIHQKETAKPSSLVDKERSQVYQVYKISMKPGS